MQQLLLQQNCTDEDLNNQFILSLGRSKYVQCDLTQQYYIRNSKI